MELRDYQKVAIDQIICSIRDGKKRPVLAAPTAFGKTILSAHLMKRCQDKGNIGFFICDRKKLIDQTIEKFNLLGIDFGVRQAQHELSNAKAKIQIATVQTLNAITEKHGRHLPEMDFVIVDEAETQYKIVKKIMSEYNNIPIIGLTATPYSKGLGKLYTNLLVPITPSELLDMGYLCPVRYYGGAHIDMKNIKSVDANTYSPSDIAEETDKNQVQLTGSIIKNWLKYGEDSQTIAFSPTQAHSRYLVAKFRAEGIEAEHIDCDFSDEDRNDLFEAHDNGEFKILSCSRLLNTGYDSPTTRCIIDCFPTKAVSVYVQRIGRITRVSKDKHYGIYLDHASNFERFGFQHEIIPERLDMGDKAHNQSQLIRERKETKPRECPQCSQLMTGITCGACGYQYPIKKELIDDNSELVELQKGKKANKNTSWEEKIRFMGELKTFARMKGYKPGYASVLYRDRFGVWPNDSRVKNAPAVDQTDLSIGWIKHYNIKRAKSNVD